MRGIIRVIKLGKARRKVWSVPFDCSASFLGNVYVVKRYRNLQSKKKPQLRELYTKDQTFHNRLVEDDLQAKKREREERINDLEEKHKDLEATRKTVEHEQQQFSEAVRKYKQDQYQVR